MIVTNLKYYMKVKWYSFIVFQKFSKASFNVSLANNTLYWHTTVSINAKCKY